MFINPQAVFDRESPLVVAAATDLLPSKMYVRLYHGRKNPNQEMDHWGFDGPVFGPLSSFVQTYCCSVRLHGEDGIEELWLKTHDDLICWNEAYYGDLEVFVADSGDRAPAAMGAMS